MEVLELTKEILKQLEEKQSEVHKVKIDLIMDAGINPREVDIKYAEQIPLSVPPILLGVIKEDEELGGKLIIIDGNHRLYSYMNVHCIANCYANIKFYSDRMGAIIDAYKMNLNHGKRLTDKEVADGIRKTIVFLKGNGKENYVELAKLLNISETSMYEYLIWDKVEKILGEDIGKMKANKINTLLKGSSENKEEKEDRLRKFWSLNKELSIRDLVKAVRHCRNTGKIVDYEKFRVEQALSNINHDDGLEEDVKRKPQTIDVEYVPNIKPLMEDNEPIVIHTPIQEAPTIKETPQPIVRPIISKDDIEELESEEYVEERPKVEVVEPQEDNAYTFAPEENITEGGSIEIINTKKTPKNDISDAGYSYTAPEQPTDNLVQVKGLVRKYSFDNVMDNIFDELQEGLLSSKGILEEILSKELHMHRQEFENSKEKYLAVVENCRTILNSIVKTIEKANKDYKGE